MCTKSPSSKTAASKVLSIRTAPKVSERLLKGRLGEEDSGRQAGTLRRLCRSGTDWGRMSAIHGPSARQGPGF